MCWFIKKKEKYTLEEIKSKLKNFKMDDDTVYTTEYSFYYKGTPTKYFKTNGEYFLKKTKEIRARIESESANTSEK